jgi:hypothetical protein
MTELASVAEIMGAPGANDISVARQLGQGVNARCPRQQCQVYADAARAAAGAAHGEGAEREGRHII